MRSLHKWQWDAAGTPVEQRRQLNGRYRFYHDEDLLQAILLRYIGMKWSIFFKGALTKFQSTPGVWKSSSTTITKSDKERRQYFLGKRAAQHQLVSVETQRYRHFQDEIFLEQLQGQFHERRGGYNDDSENEADTRRSGKQITQKLLHTLVTEIT
jgi:hypothetical protein